jgi:hypothetical protein
MQENKYVRIEYNEALSAKKGLLTSEINLLNINKKLNSYWILRKKELTLKNQLKNQLDSLKTSLNLFDSTFPESEIKDSKRRIKEINEDAWEKKSVEEELREIQEKLARLSN